MAELVDATPEADELEVAEVPGMVDALTRLSRPTPATALTAAPAVIRLSSLIAESRAWILMAVSLVGFMGSTIAAAPEPGL